MLVRVLTWAERPLSQEEALLQKKHIKSQITVCRGKDLIFENETKIELYGHNDHCYIWTLKGEACKPKITRMRNMGASASCCGLVLLQKELVHFTK